MLEKDTINLTDLTSNCSYIITLTKQMLFKYPRRLLRIAQKGNYTSKLRRTWSRSLKIEQRPFLAGTWPLLVIILRESKGYLLVNILILSTRQPRLPIQAYYVGILLIKFTAVETTCWQRILFTTEKSLVASQEFNIHRRRSPFRFPESLWPLLLRWGNCGLWFNSEVSYTDQYWQKHLSGVAHSASSWWQCD